MTDLPSLLEVRVSVPDTATGDTIAEALVGRGLAACVQVLGPITSVYSWEGVVERAEEWLVLAKTTGEAFDALAAAVGELHPYEVPEVLAVPVERAPQPYAEWLREAVVPPG